MAEVRQVYYNLTFESTFVLLMIVCGLIDCREMLTVTFDESVNRDRHSHAFVGSYSGGW
jgi:high-affinity nickel permease